MTERGKAAGGANDKVEAARSVVEDEERMVALLAPAQPPPKATRNEIMAALAPYDPPGAWREDEIFYSWLRTHYAHMVGSRWTRCSRGAAATIRVGCCSAPRSSGRKNVKRGLRSILRAGPRLQRRPNRRCSRKASRWT